MAMSKEKIFEELSKMKDSILKEELCRIVKEYFDAKKKGFVNLNEHKDLIVLALEESIKNNLLGSLGDKEASELVSKLRCEDYCIKYGKECEDLDEFDWEDIEKERDSGNDYEL